MGAWTRGFMICNGPCHRGGVKDEGQPASHFVPMLPASYLRYEVKLERRGAGATSWLLACCRPILDLFAVQCLANLRLGLRTFTHIVPQPLTVTLSHYQCKTILSYYLSDINGPLRGLCEDDQWLGNPQPTHRISKEPFE